MPIRSSCLGVIWSNPVFVANDFVCERDCYFFPSFFFSKKKIRENFYVIETFLELFLGCFILYVL